MDGNAVPNRGGAPSKETHDQPARHSILALPDLATPQEVAAGRLGASKVAGRYLVTPNAVAAYIERQKVCPSKTEAPGSITAKTAESGKSSGSSMVNDAAKARALATAEKLIKRSANGCSDKNPSAPVIQLNVASPRS